MPARDKAGLRFLGAADSRQVPAAVACQLHCLQGRTCLANPPGKYAIELMSCHAMGSLITQNIT